MSVEDPHPDAAGPDGSSASEPVEMTAGEVPGVPADSVVEDAHQVGEDPSHVMSSKSRRSFLIGGIAAVAGAGGWYWLKNSSPEHGISWPLRRALEANEKLAGTYFSQSRLAPTFAVEQAGMPRENGTVGLDDDLDLENWKLQVETGGVIRTLTLDDVKSLPRTEMVTELKCIEGWSQVVQCAGVRLADFARKYQLPPTVRYAGFETPDRGYYVGLEMASALHPQTLLCYEMNGKPLEEAHGAPLRLAVPVKYGIKNLKRLGRIRFTEERPADYWAERGYDWYAGF